QQSADKKIEDVLEEALKATGTARRVVAVRSFAALDEPAKLLDALENQNHSDVRQEAVLGLRHWVALHQDNDLQLFTLLTGGKKLPAKMAEDLMQLMHRFADDEQGRKEPYDFLILLLQDERLPMRELANCHLTRLAPEGSKIAYNAAGTPALRKRGYDAWMKLLKDGKLPPPVGKP